MKCCEVHTEPPKEKIREKPPAEPPKPRPEDVARQVELHLLSSVQPGEWPKASEVLAVLQRRGDDREFCRAAAKAAGNIVEHERGLDVLVERAVLQQLAKVWQKHQTDTVLAVQVAHIAARFWERASKDHQWFLLPSTIATAQALIDADREDWLVEAHRIAVSLHQKGLTAEARNTYSIVLARMEKTLGTEHPTTLQARNNYAVLLEESGEFEEAEKLHKAVFDRLVVSLGADHADALSSKFNLAVLKLKQGKLQEAEDCYRSVADRREARIGADHHDTLRTKSSLASLLTKRGKLQEAEELYKIVTETRQKLSNNGKEHPETLKARTHLALVIAQQGDPKRLTEADSLLREVISQRERKLGENDPETLRSMSYLAVLLEESQPVDAAQQHEKVWQRLDSAVSLERRRTRSLQGDFTASLEGKGEGAKAEALLRQVVKRRQETLTASHPDTLAARTELAALLSRRGEEAEALTLRREVAELSAQALGLSHVDTLAAKVALASSLRRSAPTRAGRVEPRGGSQPGGGGIATVGSVGARAAGGADAGASGAPRGAGDPRAEAERLHAQVLEQFDVILDTGDRNGRSPVVNRKIAVLVRD